MLPFIKATKNFGCLHYSDPTCILLLCQDEQNIYSICSIVTAKCLALRPSLKIKTFQSKRRWGFFLGGGNLVFEMHRVFPTARKISNMLALAKFNCKNLLNSKSYSLISLNWQHEVSQFKISIHVISYFPVSHQTPSI